MASESVVTIDIGASSLKLGEFKVDHKVITLERFGYREYDELQTESNRAALLKSTLTKLIQERGVQAKKAYVSLSAQMAFTKFVKLPPVGDDVHKIRQVVEFEARQNVPFEMNEVIWDYQLISSTDAEEVEVMFVAIKNEIVEELVATVEACGLKVEIVDIATSSSYNAIRVNRIGFDKCAMVLNIGSRVSNLIFSDGTSFFSRNIPIAGHAITQQVAKEFGIGLEEAEELKRRHGFVALGGAYEEPESEVAATISKIVRNVMTRLHGEVSRSINIFKNQQKGAKPEIMHLSGGSSTMLFTETFFQEKMKIDVKYFNPFQNGVSLGANVDRQELAELAHLFSEVIGLVLRISECPVEISLTPESVQKDLIRKGKMPYNYATAAVAILVPLIILAGSFRERLHYQGQIEGKAAKIEGYKKILDKINEQNKLRESVKNKVTELEVLNEERFEWLSFLNDLRKYKPKPLWITSITPQAGQAVSVLQGEVLKDTKTLSKFAVKKAERDKVLHSQTQSTDVGSVIVEGYYVQYPVLGSTGKRQKVLSKMLEDIAISEYVLVDPPGITGPLEKRQSKNKAFAYFKAQLGVKNIGRVD
ncbi:type IV pilus assembly protein PilM [Lentisphaera profundi]|uniref:Type IV pilus assembly protein PilM n=1 Tax=Lentisphaera profundi TaxID=1658616 RepID=A0ABY7VS31_9BACT|nr:type IV pilus assembly protein PilM [Lentisphaera profundi]WDE96025.1 type IV pilus assembly protein PilM [Lentisphaera profundi]